MNEPLGRWQRWARKALGAQNRLEKMTEKDLEAKHALEQVFHTDYEPYFTLKGYVCRLESPKKTH